MIANIAHSILAGGLLCILFAFASGIFSSNLYEDEFAAGALVLGVILALIGGTGAMIVRLA